MGRPDIIKEILETERIYCSHLKKLEECYDVPLQDRTKKWMDSQFHLKIFKDLNVIRVLNDNLFKELQKNYELEKLGKKPEETIGDIFLKFAPFLKTYTSYTNNFYSISESLRVLRSKNKELDEFLKLQSKVAGQTLESFLIMPVQRIPRYNLLLKELLKNTSQYHRDHSTLQKALDAMQEVAMHVNEKIRELEAVNHMLLIKTKMEKQLDRNPLTKRFIVATRLFCFEVGGNNIAFVHSRRRNTWIPCAPKFKSSGSPHLLVFNDMLLICHNPGFSDHEKEKKNSDDPQSIEFPYEQLQLEDAITLAPASLSVATASDSNSTNNTNREGDDKKMKLPWMMELENSAENKHGFTLVTEFDIYTLYFTSDDAKYDFMKSMAEILDGALKRDPSLKDNRALFIDYSEVEDSSSGGSLSPQNTKSNRKSGNKKAKQTRSTQIITRDQLPKFTSQKKLQGYKDIVNSERIEQIKNMEETECIGFCTATATFKDPDLDLFQIAFHEGDVMSIFEKVKKGKKYWIVRKCGLNVSPARRNQLLENRLPERYKDMLALMRSQQADKTREKWKRPAKLRGIDNHIIKVDKKTDKEIQELSEQLDIRSLLIEESNSGPTTLSKKDRKSLSAASFNQVQFEEANKKDDYLLYFLQQLTNIYAEKGEVGTVPQKYMVELPPLLNPKLFQLLAKRQEMELKKRRNFITQSEKRRLTVIASNSGSIGGSNSGSASSSTDFSNGSPLSLSPNEGTETRPKSKSRQFSRILAL